MKCDNGEGVENEDGHHRAEGGGEVLSSNYEQSYNIQEDVCSRHHVSCTKRFVDVFCIDLFYVMGILTATWRPYDS